MRLVRFLSRRLVCWLKGHDVEHLRVGRGQMRARAVVCRRCRLPLAIAKKPFPTMAVPRG